jgi:hypothetical protein
MEYIAFYAHKHYTLDSVVKPNGDLVREERNDVRLGLEAAIARRHSRAATSGPIPRSNASVRV